ncbi:MAG: manganese efflux pump [Clostridia bacterium]|nr:manganese efflux pump [Clostridia bacterium]
MAKIPFLLLTAFSVSLDSFFCGFSLTLTARAENKACGTGFRLKLFACVMCAVTLLCTLAALLGNTLKEREKTFALRLGGLFLFAIGALGLGKTLCEGKKRPLPTFLRLKNEQTRAFSLFSAGLGVGTDGAIAVFSLSAMGYGGILSAFTVIACHALLTDLGARVATLPKEGILPHLRICAPVILILLALSRLT